MKVQEIKTVLKFDALLKTTIGNSKYFREDGTFPKSKQRLHKSIYENKN